MVDFSCIWYSQMHSMSTSCDSIQFLTCQLQYKLQCNYRYDFIKKRVTSNSALIFNDRDTHFKPRQMRQSLYFVKIKSEIKNKQLLWLIGYTSHIWVGGSGEMIFSRISLCLVVPSVLASKTTATLYMWRCEYHEIRDNNRLKARIQNCIPLRQ